ncbi:DUF4870 family protein [Qingshengfaniella alkalisoli]|uniref:DUF4870 domain-containing protein n=1 Tax=Qingshengfaniella alkalisoli TaxID=2599296 RepID=A0A5B8I761_9RHOB|nr:hypothetical protein [Qingshengfaniella alkalisoli]QDY68386.1 hypothetical protein FPZ52_01300 [Qingshengfaniella alkalisoli]
MTETPTKFTDDTATRVKIVWGLYILSVVVGITSIVGVVLAYIWRGDDPTNPLSTHYRKQIRTFWIALGLAILGLILVIVGVGILILLAVGVYFAVMSIIGLMKALDGKPWP